MKKSHFGYIDDDEIKLILKKFNLFKQSKRWRQQKKTQNIKSSGTIKIFIN